MVGTLISFNFRIQIIILKLLLLLMLCALIAKGYVMLTVERFVSLVKRCQNKSQPEGPLFQDRVGIERRPIAEKLRSFKSVTMWKDTLLDKRQKYSSVQKRFKEDLRVLDWLEIRYIERRVEATQILEVENNLFLSWASYADSRQDSGAGVCQFVTAANNLKLTKVSHTLPSPKSWAS